MHRERFYVGRAAPELEAEHAPARLDGADVPPLLVVLDLVLVLPVLGDVLLDGDRRRVVALIDILVHVLDGLYRRAYLDVDMRVVPFRQPRVVGNNPSVVDDAGVVLGALEAPTRSAATAVLYVPVLGNDRLVGEGLWEIFPAGPLVHADRVDVAMRAARVMDQVLLDDCPENGLLEGVRELRRDELVDVVGRDALVQDDEDVRVR